MSEPGLAQARRVLSGFLFGPPSMPLWRYGVFAYALCIVPNLIFVPVVYALLGYGDVPLIDIYLGPPLKSRWDWIGIPVFSPVVETLLLAVGVQLLSLLTRNRVSISIVSALAFGAWHATRSPLWFFAVVWPFFVYTSAYQVWRAQSWRHGFAAAALPHALNNLVFVVASVLVDAGAFN